MNNIPEKLKNFLKENEAKLALFIGFLLISSLSFEFGMLWGQKWQSRPLIIEKQANMTQEGEMPKTGLSVASSNALVEKTEAQKLSLNISTCPYVGSKNSKKFYLSNCPWAKQIKPENVVCFSKPEEAISQGRTESRCD